MPTDTPAPASPAATEMALAKAVAAYEALSPVDKALHDAEQRRSFVRGHSGHDPGPNVLAAEVIALRAERDRLREALETIATAVPADRVVIPWTHEAATDAYWAAFDRGRMLARAALAEGRADG